MKRHLSLMLLAVFTLFCAPGVAFADSPQPGKPTNPEISQGDVRVLLLRAVRIPSTNSTMNFVLTYAIEVPIKGAFSDIHVSSDNEITLSIGGKPFDFAGERSSGAMGFEDLPRQNELIRPTTPGGRAMIAEDVVFTGLKIPARQIDASIQFSWRGKPMRFDFKDVPVN